MVSSPNRPCPVCTGPMTGRQRSGCSGKCRAAVSRKKKAEAQESRDSRLRGLVTLLAKEAGLTPDDFA